ncbi:hypothetical protein ACVWZN_001573 [Lysobacter sp. HA35]
MLFGRRVDRFSDFAARGYISLWVHSCKLAPLELSKLVSRMTGGANLPGHIASRVVTILALGAPAAPRSVYLAVRPFMRDFPRVEQRAHIPARGL